MRRAISIARCAGVLGVVLLWLAPPVSGQDRGAAALGSLVQGLGVSARVLMIGAHPDDEDTQLITWLTKGQHVETAYLSLTRGDGGQNLIGNELAEALGAIRTEELLAARRIDGGKQYFTRAYDFGFSKSAEEAFSQWPHDSLLHDVVTVVRAFRPHVIVAIFSGTARDGHGHHQASGIVAREAYDLAGDTVRLPRSVTAGLGPWTVLKFYRRTRQDPATLAVNAGAYDPLFGRSYAEIADISRSQHKSQGFGSLERRGVRMDGVRLEASRVRVPDGRETSHLDGIDTSWARFADVVGTAAARSALDSLPAAFAAARREFDAFAPERTLPALSRVGRWLDLICSPAPEVDACDDRRRGGEPQRAGGEKGDLARSIDVARARLYEAMATAAGVAVEATAEREVWAVGESTSISTVIYNRGRAPLTVRGIQGSGSMPNPYSAPFRITIAPDSAVRVNGAERMEQASGAWWLAAPRERSMFVPRVLGIEESARATAVMVAVDLELADGGHFTVTTPVVHRYADPVRGEVAKPIAGAPAVTVLLDQEVQYAPANAPIERAMRVHLTSASQEARQVEVTLRVPNGLLVDTATRRATLPAAGARSTLTFNVRGRLPVGRHVLEAVAVSNGQAFAAGYEAVAYDHIRTERLYRPSRMAIEAVDLKLPPRAQIAYIAGVGDNVAPALEQLGINVLHLDPSLLSRIDLSKFSAIVVGSRAFEAHPSLVANNRSLLEYVRNGGTAVVQYGQSEMPRLLPYPITIAQPHDRVTVETAPVTITDPAATVLSTPNRISAADFTGWQQDLSLYMPRTFDPRYATMIELNDPGETPNRGAILVAPYGKGTYVYTTLAFFRQLPNGVPGAARLFVNLLAAKAERVTP